MIPAKMVAIVSAIVVMDMAVTSYSRREEKRREETELLSLAELLLCRTCVQIGNDWN